MRGLSPPSAHHTSLIWFSIFLFPRQRVVAIAQPGVRWAPLTSAAASGGPDAPTQRIAKRIAASHACSRRGAEQLLAEGRVRVNGVVVTSPAMNVALDDAVLVDGTILPKPQPPKVCVYVLIVCVCSCACGEE